MFLMFIFEWDDWSKKMKVIAALLYAVNKNYLCIGKFGTHANISANRKCDFIGVFCDCSLHGAGPWSSALTLAEAK